MDDARAIALRPVLDIPRGYPEKRRPILLQIAKDFGVAERTVYLWLKKVEEGRAI